MGLRVSVVGTCWPHAVQDLFVKRLPSNETAIGVDRFMHEEVRINFANEQRTTGTNQKAEVVFIKGRDFFEYCGGNKTQPRHLT